MGEGRGGGPNAGQAGRLESAGHSVVVASTVWSGLVSTMSSIERNSLDPKGGGRRGGGRWRLQNGGSV